MSLVKGKDGGDGGGPSEPSSPSSSNGTNGDSSKNSSHNELPGHNPLLKLDVKFIIPIYVGKLNA